MQIERFGLIETGSRIQSLTLTKLWITYSTYSCTHTHVWKSDVCCLSHTTEGMNGMQNERRFLLALIWCAVVQSQSDRFSPALWIDIITKMVLFNWLIIKTFSLKWQLCLVWYSNRFVYHSWKRYTLIDRQCTLPIDVNFLVRVCEEDRKSMCLVFVVDIDISVVFCYFCQISNIFARLTTEEALLNALISGWFLPIEWWHHTNTHTHNICYGLVGLVLSSFNVCGVCDGECWDDGYASTTLSRQITGGYLSTRRRG